MKIQYRFAFDSGREEIFDLDFDASTLQMAPLGDESKESWVKLSFHQCPECPLSEDTHPACPVAQNLATVLNVFKEDRSFTKVLTRVVTSERTTQRETSLEQGLSSLMGLMMATSGCPILDHFKPMALTHLPFANENETMYRAVSTYLTAQFMRMREGQSADWDLAKLGDLYGKVSRINAAFADRVRGLKGRDANVNALILLDLFAQVGAFSFSEKWVEDILPLFGAYLDKDKS